VGGGWFERKDSVSFGLLAALKSYKCCASLTNKKKLTQKRQKVGGKVQAGKTTFLEPLKYRISWKFNTLVSVVLKETHNFQLKIKFKIQTITIKLTGSFLSSFY